MMGKKKRRVNLVINMGTTKNETVWQPATASSSSSSAAAAAAAAKDGRFRRQPGASLLHHICIPHRLLLHVLHLFVNAGMENARLLPVLIILPPPSVLILLSLSLTSSITTNGHTQSIFDSLVHLEFRQDCDVGGDSRVPPA